ncbi:RTX toxin, partial [Paramagnetospirillum kuznetsovii]
TWQSLGQDGSGWGAYGQHFNANGTKIGGEFQINTTTASDQYQPSVIGLADGSFVATWQSYGQDGSGWGAYGQHFNANGSKIGGEFLINTNIVSDQYMPTVTGMADGSFVASWMSAGQDGSQWGVYGQHFYADGTKAGGEFQISDASLNSQMYPSVIGLANGNLAVGYADTSSNTMNIMIKVLDSADMLNRDSTIANSTMSGMHDQASLTALADGSFVATWMSYVSYSPGQDANGWGVYGQHFNADGTKIGGEFLINTTTAGDQYQPSVTGLADGSFVATWQSYGQDGNGFGVYGQHFDANGSKIGGEFLINTTTASDQYQPSVTGLADG